MTTRQIGAEFTTTTTTSPTDLIEILTHDSVLNQWVPKNIAVQNFLSNVDSLTPEGVVFGGSDGKLAQDISFTYDTTDKQLMLQNMFVGTLSADGELIVATSGGPGAFGSAISIFATSDGSGHTTSITNESQSGNYTYTIPDAGADSEILVTNGAQTIPGQKAFASNVTLANSALLIKPSGIHGTFRIFATPTSDVTNPTISITNAPQSGNYTYTIPDVGNADFMMNAGDQTINGFKTFTNDVALNNSNLIVNNGNLIANTAGKGIQIKGGSNARIGTATLASGTVTVANTSVTANTHIQLTRVGIGTSSAIGSLTYTKNAGTSFTITSLDPTLLTTKTTDTSVVNWELIEVL